MEWRPFLGLKTLLVKSRVVSEGRNYDTFILFKNVNYNINEDNDQCIFLHASDGGQYKLERLNEAKTDVLVRCNCKDFRYRFMYWDKTEGSLWGNTPRKFAPTSSRPANPLQMEGICKHLMITTRALARADLFR
jgi:hypothetical protein